MSYERQLLAARRRHYRQECWVKIIVATTIACILIITAATIAKSEERELNSVGMCISIPPLCMWPSRAVCVCDSMSANCHYICLNEGY